MVSNVVEVDVTQPFGEEPPTPLRRWIVAVTKEFEVEAWDWREAMARAVNDEAVVLVAVSTHVEELEEEEEAA